MLATAGTTLLSCAAADPKPAGISPVTPAATNAAVPVGQRLYGNAEHAIRPSFVSFVNCTNVKVAPSQGPVFDLTDASDITIRKATAPAGTEVFLKVEGTNSGNIRIAESDLAAAGKKLVTGAGVAAGAVKFAD
jgi:hypothetical protein